MKILSISGSLKRSYETSNGDQHDASAVLLVNGEVISAIEEERINRIKHTDKFPTQAIKFVLEQGGIALNEVDHVCYYSLNHYLNIKEGEGASKALLQNVLYEETGFKIDQEKIFFVHHHLSHAVSSYYMSGFKESLILTIDGKGDGISGMVLNAHDKKLDVVNKYSIENSLGIYYLNVIHILGYKQFDEYKVMGLAPYGDPNKYRDLFKTFYKLLPEGNYAINLNQVKKCYLLTPRREKGEDFNQIHKDIAAALQESVEEIVLHILKYYKEKYNHKNLCLSGGVAHNCSMNGKILYSEIFENVFVQPASHDAGCAIGAALFRYHELNPGVEFKKLDHLYWGSQTLENEKLEKILKSWGGFIEFEKVDNIEKRTAELIANGAVIGWCQGRSEFGPRALGNRSILADPREEKNKSIINAMVKKREGYRPFAPSVLEEYVSDYYDFPTKNAQSPYMIFVQKVKKDKRSLLGAVTHIDGTARVQTVSKKINERYWNLINEFRKITNVPIILNTSFNNNAEPIVDSETDCIVCFLTTELNYLVIGDYIIKKKQFGVSAYERLTVKISDYNILTQVNKYIGYDEYIKTYVLKNNFDNGSSIEISKKIFDVLNICENKYTLGEVIKKLNYTETDKGSVVSELVDLWEKRFVRLLCINK